ncbi:serine/threonine-protein kinase 10 [Sarcoptes scabiei]|nr:serine/threonine-protein kinase 10 [Sarcoptes scabiei]
MATTLFFAIQNDLPTQMFRSESRLIIYQIINQIYLRFKPDFENLGANFVFGILRIVDSEVIPDCLKIVFKLLKELSLIPNYDEFYEDIFDLMACYFPIICDEKPTDEFFAIKQELNRLLMDAMLSNLSYSKFLLQLALDKLDSSYKESKIASYHLILEAFDRYRLEQIKDFLNDLWISIRIDTLKPNVNIEKDALAKNALKTLTKLIDIIHDDAEVMDKLQEKIWTDLAITFRSHELQLSLSSIQILIAMSSKHLNIYELNYHRLRPILFENFLSTTDPYAKAMSLETFLKLIEYGSKIDDFKIPTKEAMLQIGLIIDDITTNRSNDLVRLSLMILNSYVEITSFSTESNFILVIITFGIESIKQTNYDENLSEICVKLISNLLSKYPNSIENFFFQYLINELEIIELYDRKSNSFFQKIIRSLCVGLGKDLDDQRTDLKILDYLMGKLSMSKFDLTTEKNCDIFLNEIFLTFRDFVLILSFKKEFLRNFQSHCIDKLFKFMMQISNIVEKKISSVSSRSLIYQFAQLLGDFLEKTTERIETTDLSQSMVERINGIFLSESNTNLLSGSDRSIDFNKFQLEFILHCLYVSLRFLCKLYGIETLQKIWSKMESLKIWTIEDELLQKIAFMIKAQIVSNLITDEKFVNDSTEMLESIIERSKVHIDSSECNKREQKFALGCLVWISKPLFLTDNIRFDSILETILDYNSNLFTRDSSLINVLYSLEDYWQTFPSNDCFHQAERFSNKLQDMIEMKFEQTKSHHYLVHLMSHLRFCSDVKILNSIKYLRYLIDCLESKNNEDQEELNSIALTFLIRISETNPDIIAAQSLTLLRLLINLAIGSRKLKSRMKALDCIMKLIELFGSDFSKQKKEFLRLLQPTLADRKRLVRSKAAKCHWKMSMIK